MRNAVFGAGIGNGVEAADEDFEGGGLGHWNLHA